VIEGVLVGAVGAVLAIVVLAIVKIALLDPLFSGWALVGGIRTIAFPALLAILIGAGIGVSAIGSGVSLRRFLRV
jgi:cell division transport system permease protein